MKHYELPYIDEVLDKHEKIEDVQVILENIVRECSNPECSNLAMARLARQTYQNLEQVLIVAKELKKKRAQ